MWRDTVPTSADLLESLRVTETERDAIAAFPQGGKEWLLSRQGRLTASRFAAAAGHLSPSESTRVLKDMVWPEDAGLEGFAASLAQYGTDNEPVARRVYLHDRARAGLPRYAKPGCTVSLVGLLVSLEHGWLGASPDFVVDEPADALHPCPKPANAHHSWDPVVVPHAGLDMTKDPEVPPVPTDGSVAIVRGCGEIKCPAAVKQFYSVKKEHARHGIPAQYYDQIQGAMAVNGWPWCDFVVYTPEATQITRLWRNENYWKIVLFPALERFYFNRFLPLLGLRREGKLARGQTVPGTIPVPRKLPAPGGHHAKTSVASEPFNPDDWAAIFQGKPVAAAMPAPSGAKKRSRDPKPSSAISFQENPQ